MAMMKISASFPPRDGRPCYSVSSVEHTEGARWSSGIDAAIGARGRGSRPVYYLTVQRPWTSR